MMETDEDLLARIAAKQHRAFEKIYDSYSRGIFSLAFSILRDKALAGEIMQDVFLSIWQQASSFDPSRGSARAWILAIAHHRAVDVKRKSQRSNETQAVPETVAGEDSVVDQACQEIAKESLREALTGLSQPQLESLVLAYYAGWSQREISEKTGAPLGTIKTRIRDALKLLRLRLDKR